MSHVRTKEELHEEWDHLGWIEEIETREPARSSKTMDTVMGKDDSHPVYKIEILDGKKPRKVYVDAMTQTSALAEDRRGR